MFKNLTLNQILLIGIATVLLLLTSVSFYLLQDPSAPLPFAARSPINTILPIPPSPTNTPAPSSTSLPTRQTSYTPFAIGSPTSPPTVEISGTPETTTAVPTGTSSPGLPTNAATPQPTSGLTNTVTPSPTGPTAIPTASQTLVSGEHVVTGRILQNSTPIANVKVSFGDDDPPREATTNSGGHYFFTSLAPGTNFVLQFLQADNPQITPVAEIASLIWIEGNLPTGVDIITLPDIDVSLHLGGMIFELEAPADGAAYSAAAINPNNLLPFNWTQYNQGEYYFIELGASGSDAPIWISDDTTSTNVMWDGTLDNGSHISEGSYWWRVGTSKALDSYDLFAFTPNNDIDFNP